MAEQESAHLTLLRATLRHAAEHTRYYGMAFSNLDLDIHSLDDLREFPLLTREALTANGLDTLAEGVVPEYLGLTSGTTFGASAPDALLHYQTEAEHTAWVNLHNSVAEQVRGERPLMLRLRDVDHGVEIAGTFPGCFSLPLEKPYHFDLVMSVLQRDWSFPGFTKRVRSVSGPLNILKLLTLLCMERRIDPVKFEVDFVMSSGWQITTRWRDLIEGYWDAPLHDVYGLAEAPGMFAPMCSVCCHYHFSPLSVVEVLGLDNDDPVTLGVGRVVVTCLLPLAQSQPIIRYDTNDLISIVGRCPTTHRLAFDFLGRRSKIVLLQDVNGSRPVLASATVTEVLDSMPDVANHENARANRFGLRNTFGQPRYSLSSEASGSELHIALYVELRWPPMHYPQAARRLRKQLRQRILDASPTLTTEVEHGRVRLEIQTEGPGALTLDPHHGQDGLHGLTIRERATLVCEEDG